MKNFIINSKSAITSAIAFISAMDISKPKKVTITEAESARTIEQNDKMWAMLGDVEKQVLWHGQYLKDYEWKDMVTAALKRYKVVPGIDGGFVVIGQRTSKMSIKAMIEVIEFLYAFGADHDVKWTEKPKPDYEQYAKMTA